MKLPATTIDEQYSDPAAVAVEWEQTNSPRWQPDSPSTTEAESGASAPAAASTG